LSLGLLADLINKQPCLRIKKPQTWSKTLLSKAALTEIERKVLSNRRQMKREIFSNQNNKHSHLVFNGANPHIKMISPHINSNISRLLEKKKKINVQQNSSCKAITAVSKSNQ